MSDATFRTLCLIAAVGIVTVSTFLYVEGRSMQPKTFTVGMPGTWGNLNPALQHNRYGDIILANVFEPLVRIQSSGVIRPCAAKSWEVTDDMRVFRFRIDDSRRFSDGTHLSAQAFKDSWEAGLRLSPLSANSSLADGLFDLEGFEAFDQTGTISGLIVRPGNELELRFKHEFRMAFNYLSDIRFAVAKYNNGKPIGSSAFMIGSENDSIVELVPNPFSHHVSAPKNILIKNVPSKDAFLQLTSGKIDLNTFSEFSKELRASDGHSGIDSATGPAAGHANLMLNSNEGRIFSSIEMRRALQALVHKHLASFPLPDGYSKFSSRDPQTFFPLQKGRISESEAQRLIVESDATTARLIEATRRSPIYIVTVEGEEWVIDFLRSLGLTIDQRSTPMNPKQRLQMYYKTHEADVVFGTFGVHYGDPDGLYHLLGTNGAITSPMLAKQKSAALLDEGRHILDQDKIDRHYQKVAVAILEEVPYVHLFFAKNLVTYRNASVTLNDGSLNTGDLLFDELIAD